MFSLPQEPSFGLVFINLVLLFAVYIFQKRALRMPYVVSSLNRRASIIIMFVFTIFSFWGSDWFHYLESYPELCLGNRGHMEDVYVWIAQHLSVGYLSFRFVIWGTGLVFLLLTIERLPLKKDLIILFFGSFWIIWFSYARVSLGLAICFWGLAVFYNPYRNKTLSRIIAILAISISYIFHKSIFVLIIGVVLTMLSLRLKPKVFFLMVLISIPLIFMFINSNISNFFMLDADSDTSGVEQSIYFGQRYLEYGQNSNRVRGVGERFLTILRAIPYYLIFIQNVLMILKHNNNTESKILQSFIRLYIILVVLSTLFLVNSSIYSTTMYVRFLRFAAFPSAVLMAYYWEQMYYPKLTRWTFIITAIATFGSVGYSLYLHL